MINNITQDFIFRPYLTYLISFLGILVIFAMVILHQFGGGIFFDASLNSSRYLLSAMAQALAAVLAMVVGFSFIALQLSAHSGGSRISDLFLKSRAFWAIIVLYGFSILYDLVILRIITEENVILLVPWLNVSILLTFISFASLFPYVYGTIDQLKPEKKIRGIIKIRNDDVNSLKRDTILTVAEIMNKALRANDPHTLKVGLEELEKLIVEKIESGIDSKEKLEIAKYYTGKVYRLADIACIENDESALVEITESIERIGLEAIESRWIEVPEDLIAQIKSDRRPRGGVEIPGKTDNYDDISEEIRQLLRNVGEKAIGREWDRATKSILDARSKLRIKSYEERVVGLGFDTFELSSDFRHLSEEEKIFSMQYFLEAMRNIIIELIKRDIYPDDWSYRDELGDIFEQSVEVVDKDYCNVLDQLIGHLIDIGIEAVKKNYKLKEDIKEHFNRVSISEKCSDTPVDSIGNRGFGIASASKKSETLWICSCLEDIGLSCISKRLDEPTYHIFDFLEGIGNNYNVSYLNRVDVNSKDRETDEALEVTGNIIEIIEELGNKSIEGGLEKSSRETLSSLIKIGMMNENVELKKRICEILKSMHRKIDDKEVFKSVIERYGKSQGYELDKF